MAQGKEHWQVDKTLQQCNQHLLEHSQHYSDVTFSVHCKREDVSAGPVEIPALRLMLLTRSPVFHAMFSGENWKETMGTIHVDDIKPDAFIEMLRFAYTDEVKLTTDNVTGVLYASKKYIITNLTKKCIEFLQARLTSDTATQILEQSLIYEEQELKEKALCEIKQSSREVLTSESFIHISKATLHEILQLNTLLTKEIEVFQATMKWARNKCEELTETVNGKNLRKALGDDLYLLRFPTMDIKEFNDIVLRHDVLTPAEGFEIFRYLTNGFLSDALKFSTFLRQPCNSTACYVASPFETVQRSLTRETLYIKNKLACRLSKQLHLTKIFVHGCEMSHALAHCLQVSVVQKTRLFEYMGAQSAIPMANGTFTQYAIDVPRVTLEAGDLELCINLTVTCKLPGLHTIGKMAAQTSPSATALTDQNIRMTFPATAENLLLGIGYEL